jgi:hypothetical protein
MHSLVIPDLIGDPSQKKKAGFPIELGMTEEK